MKEELFLENGVLVSRDVWNKAITQIRGSVKLDLNEENGAAAAVGKAAVQAVLSRVPSGKKFGVMFSGGVDSSFIALAAKRAGRPFACYAVGFKDDGTKQPEDLDSAVEAAKLIGVELNCSTLSLAQAERVIKKTVEILGPELSSVVNVGVGAVVLACVEMAQKDGVTCLFSGLGSEEIFAGYERHKKSSDVDAECWSGLFNMHERDLLRDFAIAKSTGMHFLTPFLDAELISAAMRVPAKLKLDSENSKLILRRVAEKEGLPRQVAWRKKRAAQYGSRLDRAIDKLAVRSGFALKKDYLASLSSKQKVSSK